VRQAHELPAPAARTAGHRGRRPGRVADLQVDRVEHARLVEDHVDDEPVVEEAEVLDRQICQPAHRTVGSVAADDVARRDRRAVGAGHDDAVVMLVDGHDLDAAAHVHAEVGGAPGEQRLEGGLVEHRRRGPARRAVALLSEAEQRGAGGVAPLVDLGGLADRPQGVTDAARLQDAPDLVVEVHGTRQRVGLGPALQHRDRPAALGEQDRQRAADRPEADDGDVTGHVVRRGWWPHALMRS
jgi:hypothetical protein